MPIRKSGRALTDRPAVRLALVTLASVIMAVNIKSFVEAGGLFPGGFNGLTLLIQRSLQQFAGDSSLLYYTTDETKEGRDAFKEKRKPDFSEYPMFP